MAKKDPKKNIAIKARAKNRYLLVKKYIPFLSESSLSVFIFFISTQAFSSMALKYRQHYPYKLELF